MRKSSGLALRWHAHLVNVRVHRAHIWSLTTVDSSVRLTTRHNVISIVFSARCVLKHAVENTQRSSYHITSCIEFSNLTFGSVEATGPGNLPFRSPNLWTAGLDPVKVPMPIIILILHLKYQWCVCVSVLVQPEHTFINVCAMVPDLICIQIQFNIFKI